MTVHLRPLTLLDLLTVGCEMPPEEIDQIVAFGTTETIEQRAARIFLAYGQKWAVADFATGRAVACGGVTPIRSGVGETWFWASPKLWEHENATLVVAQARDMLFGAGYHRIETYCLASREQAHRWYARLGLKKEATLEKFCTDGRDAVLFVAIRGEG